MNGCPGLAMDWTDWMGGNGGDGDPTASDRTATSWSTLLYVLRRNVLPDKSPDNDDRA